MYNISSNILRTSYLQYAESHNPTALNYVELGDGFELGIVNSSVPDIAKTISAMLTNSLEQARSDLGGHLPPNVVKRVQQEIISPDGVANLWGAHGLRFVLSRNIGKGQHELVGTALIGRSKDTVFFFTGRYNNLKHSMMKQDIDFEQLDTNVPGQLWFDRFAFPPVELFKPQKYHQIANMVISISQRGEGYSHMMLDNIIKYYAKSVVGDKMIHSQMLLCGKGFWQIGDPPWHKRMLKLGFYHRMGAESFFIHHDWAPIPSLVIGGKEIDILSYNQQYGLPGLYQKDPYPSAEHLLFRVPEVIALGMDPKAKLQYFQMLRDF